MANDIAGEGHGPGPGIETAVVGRARADSDGCEGQDVANKGRSGAESGRASHLPEDIAGHAAVDDRDGGTY